MSKPSALPDRGANYPHWNKPGVSRLAAWALTRSGWTIGNPFPDIPKCIVIVVPHTSNWDFVVGAAVAFALDLRPRFVGKHTLFRWPLGILMRALGGIPVNRSATEGLVPRVAKLVADSDGIVLGITPEGTRKAVDRWRTGFYHIASQAGVPVVPCYLNLADRFVQFGLPVQPSGNPAADLLEITEFYKPWIDDIRTNADESR